MSTAAPSTPDLTALVSNVQDAIVLLDAAGKVIFESSAAAARIGVASQDVLAPYGMERIHPDERDSVVQLFRRTIETPGAVARATYRFRRENGEWRHLEAIAKNLLQDESVGGVLITFRDVTERIEALERAREAANARDEFIARMSHELRTPLHAILGWSGILQETAGPAAVQAAEQIEGAGLHMLKMVDDAIDLAAIQEGRIELTPKVVDVAEVVSQVVTLLQPLADARDIRFSCVHDRERCSAVVDPNRLRQVLVNLVGNAVKYGRYAGEVRVRCITLAGRLRIVVGDDGPGLAADRLDEIFERYTRVEADQIGTTGSGLGLAISRRIVELMGGRIGVESRPGCGSDFWIEIPAPPPTRRHASATDLESRQATR